MASVKSELCPTRRGTGYAERNGVSRVVRCDCVKTSRSGLLMDNARIPAHHAHCEFEGFGLQEDLMSARKSVSYSLTERVGEPMRSRLYEMCKTVVMQGKDFRQRFKPDEHRL